MVGAVTRRQSRVIVEFSIYGDGPSHLLHKLPLLRSDQDGSFSLDCLNKRRMEQVIRA